MRMDPAFVVLLSLLAGGSAHADVTWVMATAYAQTMFVTENLQQFSDEVDRTTAGKVKIQIRPNAELYKMPEILQAVSSGKAQAGEVIMSAYGQNMPLMAVDSIPFLATSYVEAKSLWLISRPKLEELLGKQGLKVLFAVPWPPQGLYVSGPLNKLKDLKGTKMRAYNPATTRLAELVGAKPTTVQLAELDSALSKGAVDNFLSSAATGIDTKIWNHMKYFYDVKAWLPKNLVVANSRAFDALDEPGQEALLKSAAQAEERGWRVSEEKSVSYNKQLAANGMKVEAPGVFLEQELIRIGEKLTREWLRSSGSDGLSVALAFEDNRWKAAQTKK
jgi:TRAP-type transport system periplasmic protein